MNTGGGNKTLKSAIYTTFGPPGPWIGSDGIPPCITHQPLPTYQISLKSE